LKQEENDDVDVSKIHEHKLDICAAITQKECNGRRSQ
jgi:hypothetical protein